MEKFYQTRITESILNSESEIKLEVESKRLSQDDSFETGRSRLIFLEVDSLKKLRKAERKVNELREMSLLPTETQYSDPCLVNEKDNGRFIKIELPNSSGFFVKFRSFKIGTQSHISGQFETIVTSQCMFGFGGTKATLIDGSEEIFRNGKFESKSGTKDIAPQKVVAWQIDDRISLYEAEALYRKVNFINGLLYADTKFINIVLNNPRVEYYLAGLDFFNQGFISSELLTKWFDIVDKRTDRLNRLTLDRLNSRLSVVLKSPLEELRDYLRHKIKSNSQPTFEESFEVLSKDKLWRDVLGLNRPNSWISLVEVAEALEELRGSYETNKGTVIVKSPKHENTFGNAIDIAEQLCSNNSFNLMAMYPHEKVIVSHNTPKRTLLSYVSEPMSITTTKKVINLYKGSVDQI